MKGGRSGGHRNGIFRLRAKIMDLEHKAINRIKTASEISLHHYGKPLVCTYSGGKDSDVMLELFRRSGVPFEVCNSHTTADAPQTVYHIREVFRELELKGIKCSIDYHIRADGKRTTMWNLIPEEGIPPTRLKRYCCSVLKESANRNRMISTGVRWAESSQRKTRQSFETAGAGKSNAIMVSDEKMLLTDNDDTRRLFEQCQMKGKTIVNPIIDWKDSDIWGFIHSEKICTNCLYKEGFNRVGCVGCPIAGKRRWFEFRVFPTFREAYIKAFDRMLLKRKMKGKGDGTGRWKSGYGVFLWWMEDRNVEGQMDLFDDGFIE